MAEVPYGYCQCGCGEKTSLVERTYVKGGLVKGEPRRYLVGHNNRKSGVEYIVDPETGCWVWQLTRSASGYGSRYAPDRPSRTIRAHRFYYEQANGPVPPGLDLDHLCRNRACVNPEHLEPVTRAENAQRGARAKLTAEEVAAIRGAEGIKRGDLARRYGVAPVTIYMIRAGYGWANVKAA